MKDTRQTFPREERLKSVKEISGLFEKGLTFLCYPVKVVWSEKTYDPDCPLQVAFSVSKKNFKKATGRNSLKRKMKEAYRLNRWRIGEQLNGRSLNCMFVYIAREKLAFPVIEKGIRDALYRIVRTRSEIPGSKASKE